MPKTHTDTELLAAVRRHVEAHNGVKAAAARELGVTRVLLGRFLQTGRAIGRNRETLRTALAAQGCLEHPKIPEDLGSQPVAAETIQLERIVRQALLYLVQAVDTQASIGGGSGNDR